MRFAIEVFSTSMGTLCFLISILMMLAIHLRTLRRQAWLRALVFKKKERRDNPRDFDFLLSSYLMALWALLNLSFTLHPVVTRLIMIGLPLGLVLTMILHDPSPHPETGETDRP